MADIIDTLYRLRNMAGIAAQELRTAINEAEAVRAKLDAFADDAEYTAELTASSDRFPTHHANTPRDSGLVREWTDLCPFAHPAIDNGAPCIYLAGHESAGIPHTTANGLFWSDPEPTSSGSTPKDGEKN